MWSVLKLGRGGLGRQRLWSSRSREKEVSEKGKDGLREMSEK